MPVVTSAFGEYLESKVHSADPLELVRILYRTALEAVGGARRYLQAGDVAARSQAITRAMAILTELMLSLDREAGGPLARNLLELYDYMQRRLIQANAEQTDQPLAEVGRLLATLLEGWMNCRPTPEAEPAEAPDELPLPVPVPSTPSYTYVSA